MRLYPSMIMLSILSQNNPLLDLDFVSKTLLKRLWFELCFRHKSLVKKPSILPRSKTAWGVVKWVRVVKTEGENSNPRCTDLSCGDRRRRTQCDYHPHSTCLHSSAHPNQTQPAYGNSLAAPTLT